MKGKWKATIKSLKELPQGALCSQIIPVTQSASPWTSLWPVFAFQLMQQSTTTTTTSFLSYLVSSNIQTGRTRYGCPKRYFIVPTYGVRPRICSSSSLRLPAGVAALSSRPLENTKIHLKFRPRLGLGSLTTRFQYLCRLIWICFLYWSTYSPPEENFNIISNY